MARKAHKKHGRFGNENRVVHGGYMDLSRENLDGRTKIARTLREIETTLVTALGGDPSPQEILLIKRASVKAVRCSLVEQHLLAVNADVSQSLRDDYLRWARELRSDLLALGLERRQRNVTDLQTYLSKNYGQSD